MIKTGQYYANMHSDESNKISLGYIYIIHIVVYAKQDQLMSGFYSNYSN